MSPARPSPTPAPSSPEPSPYALLVVRSGRGPSAHGPYRGHEEAAQAASALIRNPDVIDQRTIALTAARRSVTRTIRTARASGIALIPPHVLDLILPLDLPQYQHRETIGTGACTAAVSLVIVPTLPRRALLVGPFGSRAAAIDWSPSCLALLLHPAEVTDLSALARPSRTANSRRRPVGPCPCECNTGGRCGGCGHTGCGGRR